VESWCSGVVERARGISGAQLADGVDGSVVGGGDVDEVDPIGQVCRVLMAEEEFHCRPCGGLVIVQGTLGDVLDVREHQDDLFGPCARVDAGQELACVLQFDVDLLFSHVDLPILGVCEGSLFSIDPVIGGGAVISVCPSRKAAAALRPAATRSDTGARSTGPWGPEEEGGMVTIRAATTAAGEAKDMPDDARLTEAAYQGAALEVDEDYYGRI